MHAFVFFFSFFLLFPFLGHQIDFGRIGFMQAVSIRGEVFKIVARSRNIRRWATATDTVFNETNTKTTSSANAIADVIPAILNIHHWHIRWRWWRWRRRNSCIWRATAQTSSMILKSIADPETFVSRFHLDIQKFALNFNLIFIENHQFMILVTMRKNIENLILIAPSPLEFELCESKFELENDGTANSTEFYRCTFVIIINNLINLI